MDALAHNNIKVLDIKVPDDDFVNFVKENVLPEVRPEWHLADITNKALGMGFMNRMTCYHLRDDEGKDDAVVVRAYSLHTNRFFDYDSEALLMQLACHAGIFPAVLAFFNNGVVYEYTKGRNLTAQDIRDPTVIRPVAQALARLHYLDINSVPTISRDGQKATHVQRRKNFPNLRKAIQIMDEQLTDEKVPESVRDICCTLPELYREFDYFEKLVDELELPLVQSHNDFHFYNVIYNDTTHLATIVDYELCDLNWVGHDLAIMLSGSFYANLLFGVEQHGPVDDDTMALWVRCYLEQKYEGQGHEASEVPDKEIELLMIEIKILLVLQHLYWMIVRRWLLLEKVPAPIEFFSISREMYYQAKPTLSELRDRYLQVRMS